MAELKVGIVTGSHGAVTSLVMVRPGHDRDMERDLGFREGQLSQGYYVLLLRQFFTCEDIWLAGTPYYSGRRMGRVLPLGSTGALRSHMFDQVMKAHGLGGVEAFRELARKGRAVTGRKRLVKLLPIGRSAAGTAAKDPQASGRGVPQLELRRERRFLVAAEVRPDGSVTTPDFRINVREQGVGARRQVRRFLEAA